MANHTTARGIATSICQGKRRDPFHMMSVTVAKDVVKTFAHQSCRVGNLLLVVGI